MNYYEILGIGEKAKYEEIRKAYHKMALKYHPDKCQDEDAEQKFKNVVEAYEVLIDPVKRRRYDLSRKLNDTYEFSLPVDILKFSKYFFSEKNIQKFKNMGNIISQQAENFGLNINFEIMLHSFLNNIRNGKYHSLIEEYQLFKKFYEGEATHNYPAEQRYQKEKEEKQKEEYEERKTQITTLSEGKLGKFKSKCVNVNIKVNLENVYQRDIKVANLDVDKRCPKCDGQGVILIEIPNKKCKNSKSKYRRKNLSRKKNDSFLDKKICTKCQGTTKVKKEQRYLVDTSMDKICYLGQYFMNAEEPNYDLIFNLQIKPHSLYYVDKDDRYNINLDRNISLQEFYYGGNLKVPFLDGTSLDVEWSGFNNGKIQNSLIIPNRGLLIIPENNYMVKQTNNLINNYKLDDASRGDLKVNLRINIPIYQEIELEEKRELIEKLSN